MPQQDRLIGTLRIVVRLGITLNHVFLAALCLAMLLSWLLASPIAGFLSESRPGIDATSTLVGLRWEMVIGAIMAMATTCLLTALKRIIDSARDGDPFVGVNARRLQRIGWSLLVLQLLDIFGIVVARAFPSLGTAAPDSGISPGGWIAVLMVFVLSRVFAVGAVMRDELEATI